MRIRLTSDAFSGNVVLPLGEYIVALLTDTQQFNLFSGGQDFLIPAIRRKSKFKTRSMTVAFYCGGGRSWSLIVNTPKHGEWYAPIEYGTPKL